MHVAQMIAKGHRVVLLGAAPAERWPRANLPDVLLLHVRHQNTVSGPLLEPAGHRKALIGQTPGAEGRTDQGVTVDTYHTPCRLENVEMAAAMLLPSGVAVKPFEAEETIFYSDSPLHHDSRYILFATAGMNVVNSSPLCLW